MPAPRRTPSIALAMIVRDEAGRVGAAIASARALVDQVVVVDTGSVDDTKQVAYAAGAEVYEFVWCADFAAARNAALEHCTTDWVLVLDADEQLVMEPGGENLRALLAGERAIYTLTINSAGAGGQQVLSAVPRLFPRLEHLRYSGRLHEMPVDARKELATRHLPHFTIHHAGYTPDAMARADKGRRNHDILKTLIAESPDDPQLRLYLGHALRVMKQYDEAADQMRLALYLCRVYPMLTDILLTYDQAAVDLLSILGLANKHAQAMLEFQVIASWRRPEHPGFWMSLANAQLACGHFELAAASALEAMACRHDKAFILDRSAITWMPDAAFGMAMARLGRLEEGIGSFTRALADPDCGHREYFEEQRQKLVALRAGA